MGGVKKNLLYITSEYPNERGDTAFISTEIKYVARAFENVIVLSHGKPDVKCVEPPRNVKVFYFRSYPKLYRYIIHLGNLFSPVYWKEILLLVRHKKSLLCAKNALVFLGSARLERKQIKKKIKEHNIDLCYTFWYYQSTLACLLALKHMGLNSVKPMCTCTRTHGFDLYEFRNTRMYQPYKLQMDRRIEKVFFISRNGLEYYKKTFATGGGEKYRLSYLGTENSIAFESHGYGEEIRLLSVSGLVPVKRVQLIIEILSECARLGIKISWNHIGGGTEEAFIKRLAKENLVGTSVSCRFLGAMPNSQVHEYYRENIADLFISTSESEGLPVSMMETMSYGVPVIAPNVGGIGEIVDSGCGWLLTKDGCVAEGVEAIKAWQKMSSEQRHAKAYAAYKKWSSTFNAEKNYTEFASELVKITEWLKC